MISLQLDIMKAQLNNKLGERISREIEVLFSRQNL